MNRFDNDDMVNQGRALGAPKKLKLDQSMVASGTLGVRGAPQFTKDTQVAAVSTPTSEGHKTGRLVTRLVSDTLADGAASPMRDALASGTGASFDSDKDAAVLASKQGPLRWSGRHEAPKTLEDLIDWMQCSFDMIQGAPKAYYNARDVLNFGAAQARVIQRLYTVYAFGAEHDAAKAAEAEANKAEREAKLVRVMYTTLALLRGSTGWSRPIMVVRSPLRLTHETREMYGQGFISDSAVQDGWAEVPPGWSRDIVNNLWRPSAGLKDVTKIYLRCDIPHAPSDPVSGWDSPTDGDTVFRKNATVPGAVPDGAMPLMI